MKNLLSIAIVCVLAWYGYSKYQSDSSSRSEHIAAETSAPPIDTLMRHDAPAAPSFSCDGRTRCPQMHSCEEATYFLQHCPGVEMDGDGDGVPCESQWCSGG
jgi:hypothetical protein